MQWGVHASSRLGATPAGPFGALAETNSSVPPIRSDLLEDGLYLHRASDCVYPRNRGQGGYTLLTYRPRSGECCAPRPVVPVRLGFRPPSPRQLSTALQVELASSLLPVLSRKPEKVAPRLVEERAPSRCRAGSRLPGRFSAWQAGSACPTKTSLRQRANS